MRESRVILITIILNLIVAILKLVFGILFSFSTLIADSIQSFVDFITDITSLIANKIGRRRANKTYPFGYGQVYYFANLFTGIVLFLIGVFIIYQFFFFNSQIKINKMLFIIIVVILILKLIVINLLNFFGKKYKSELMIEASKESATDFISTCIVLVILIMSSFEKYIPSYINIDKIGSLGMAIFVFWTSIRMIISNTRGLLTNDESNEEIKQFVLNSLENFKNIKIKKIKAIKMSTYYSLFLQIEIDRNLTIRKYLSLEKKIKSHLKTRNKLIRFIDIEPV